MRYQFFELFNCRWLLHIIIASLLFSILYGAFVAHARVYYNVGIHQWQYNIRHPMQLRQQQRLLHFELGTRNGSLLQILLIRGQVNIARAYIIANIAYLVYRIWPIQKRHLGIRYNNLIRLNFPIRVNGNLKPFDILSDKLGAICRLVTDLSLFVGATDGG